MKLVITGHDKTGKSIFLFGSQCCGLRAGLVIHFGKIGFELGQILFQLR